ncbi:hypothetical protein RO3G_07341 [Lichtheimia corymbifera JMRC:FSU:9682]|uniref:RGS domain-containing protein n=1 Tax=Lichtheimia corymbifera JMRC:FSU:9682 TaxID=1263082 RepID=A0A068RTD4_9FUNG|nr:hypothetical protein RO3G_07341 [Lichtheimia corymbifera JMRC:FSU:9682]
MTEIQYPASHTGSILTHRNGPNDSEDRYRPWSIRLANSRLQSQGLETALESDLNLHLEKEREGIPMTVLSSSSSSNMGREREEHRHSNNPFRDTVDHHKQYGFNDPFAEAPIAAWQEMKDYNLRANGLPTLDQMMRLHTLAPLTQSNFMAFLRRRGVHQNVSFLLELETHDKLWHAHLSSARRHTKDRLSRFLESAAEKPANTKDTMMEMYDPHHHHHTTAASAGAYTETPDTQNLLGSMRGLPVVTSPTTTEDYASRIPQGQSSSLGRHDLQQNATRIYRTFCSPLDAAQPIHLPDDYRTALEELIEKHHRPEPAVFNSARSHVFEVLNVFYYPQFVDAMLHTNVARSSARLYSILGCILLTVAFAVELSLILLDQGSIPTRWWGLLPFFLGWSCFITGFTHFSWWLAFTSKCETSFFVFTRIQDKSVLRAHRKRAYMFLAISLVISIICSIIFVFIPGHRMRRS